MPVPLVSLCSLNSLFCLSFFFFFNDTATTEIYTLSLHDALPIFEDVEHWLNERSGLRGLAGGDGDVRDLLARERDDARARRSEEHTSELQSLAYLVCRLLLEKKKKTARRDCDDRASQHSNGMLHH